MNLRILFFFLVLRPFSGNTRKNRWRNLMDTKSCQIIKENKSLAVPDKFFGFLTATKHWVNGTTEPDFYIVFLKTGSSEWSKCWPEVKTEDFLYLKERHLKWNVMVLKKSCNRADLLKNRDLAEGRGRGSCHLMLSRGICNNTVYNMNQCNRMAKNVFKVNLTAENLTCLNCNSPVKSPEEKVEVPGLTEVLSNKTEELSPSKALEVMNTVSNLATSMNTSSAELTVGDKVLGVIVRERDPQEVDEVSFGYKLPNSSINIIESARSLSFSRSITVPKEAFEQSVAMNVTVPFAVVMRFNKLDGMNGTVLGNEVIAIEMGAQICNLTDRVSINFQNLTYEGIPSCQTWNGEGEQMNWTDVGCETMVDGSRLTCQCSHMTFFAILLTPLNQTISSSNLSTLTTITQVGCGLSILFLCVVLFMHFFLRKTKASKGTRILIHLVSAMFMLNLCFLVNSHVARLKSHVGCTILAAVMHYFLLATFSWFAVQAFHICLQLYTGGNIAIRRYMLKVSVTSWALPSIAVIVLLAIGKYGESLIHTSDSKENVAMCWITDNEAHYIINIGYYALVFLFTLTTFIMMLSWLFCHKKRNTANTQMNSTGKTIGVIFGLCCLLGITWGFAFFAYGVFQIPAYYIFSILNSFQGFFLFIFYYNISRDTNSNKMDQNTNSSSSSNTLKTSLDYFENPYGNLPGKK